MERPATPPPTWPLLLALFVASAVQKLCNNYEGLTKVLVRSTLDKPVADGGLGYSCIAEVRTVETILTGEAKTPFLKHGDTVRIEMLDDKHHTLFGAIEQTVQPA